MYRYRKLNATSIESNDSVEGESIEQKVDRAVNNNEPINDRAEKAYTERKDGVLPEYNIRTDRFEIAVEAMDKVDKSNKAHREERHKAPKTDDHKDGGESGETPANSGTSKEIK